MTARALLCSLLLLTACGSSSGADAGCSVSTCQGCCSATGICEPGTTHDACGSHAASCTTCPAAQICSANKACLPAVIPDGGKLVFTTSAVVAGDFGGVDGADALCNTAASAGGLGGTYVAWLSFTTLTSPSNHLGFERVTANAPYYLTCPDANGYVQAFAGQAQLRTSPSVVLDCDEHGTHLPSANPATPTVWTGSSNAVTFASSCNTSGAVGNDWTSAAAGTMGQFGWFGGTPAEWLQASNSNAALCSASAHLYCFQN